MTDATFEVTRSLSHVITTFIEAATKLAVALAERRAQRLREAAMMGERFARAERTRLAAHRAADAAIWRQTNDPGWWAKATPDQMARAWQAASMWQHADAEAAGARQAMAERLRQRGVDITARHHLNAGDTRWLSVALALANTERVDQAAESAADIDRLTTTEHPRATNKHSPDATDSRTRNQPTASAVHGRNREFRSAPGSPPGFMPTTKPATPTSQTDDAKHVVSQRMQELLRVAWSADKVNRVVQDPAWPMLATTLNRLLQKGIDVPKLLDELPFDTTGAKVPAVLTAWTLRAAAAGAAQLHAAQRQRSRHFQRLPEQPVQQSTNALGPLRQPSGGPNSAVQTHAAQQIRVSYPITTQQSLNSRRPDIAGAVRPTVPEHLHQASHSYTEPST